ncbi:transglutaminase-like domain-containing protein [Thermodesulfobacteriota bacterium]
MESVDAVYISPTSIVDSDHKTIIEYANDAVSDAGDDPVEKAVRLYYTVRDDIWYDPYYPFYLSEHYRASNVLKSGRGFCISKISLLCAVGRACGIPSRAGFATVRNHLATRKLLEYLGSDLFVYHGFTEFFLEGKWVKATPAFNIELCKKHKVIPLEFNGREDSIFHEYNSEKKEFMEYIEYHGSYADIPVETILAEWRKAYGSERVNQWISMLEAAEEMPGSDVEIGDS